MSQSEFSKPDYAALVKAVSHSSPTPPDWLAVGQQIYSPSYGFGQVIGVLGSRLVVANCKHPAIKLQTRR
ncbi:hypothetical protein [Scytonema sp. PCC 10023]|uniref:hypothetical protein n=1 Tax=Scytonema sp. PCC 10023 TaxID=1680591 RepID=UPI0039C6AF0C